MSCLERLLSPAFACLLLTACSVDAASHGGVGSLNLALTSQSGGITYRLTDARFALTGPESKGFASGEEPQVEVELMPGSYTLELLAGYRLVRADDPEAASVTATLLSANPAPLLVEAGMATQIALRFELADGTRVSNERGSVSVQLDLAGQADAGGADPCLTGLRINEVDYDQPSSDDAEFVEVVNTADCPADLSSVNLELVNGSDGKVYASYPLLEAGKSLAPHARLVVADPPLLANLPKGVASVSLKTLGLQNGPDGVRLVSGERVLDGFAYEGALPGTGEGDPSPADEAELAHGRCPDAFDSDDNALDFQLETPTPGAPNACP
ncbi:MAG: lamin tail domain-containing protein [Myxococcales bacterium]